MKGHRRVLRLRAAGLVLAAGVLLVLGTMAAIAAQGASGAGNPADAGTKPADLRVTVAGMQVAVDPQTGKLRPPTAEESRALAQALRQEFVQPSAPLQVVRAANGAEMVELPEDFMETAVLLIAQDGTRQIQCMSAEEAQRITSLDKSATSGVHVPSFNPYAEEK
jgi:hypothetical protein